VHHRHAEVLRRGLLTLVRAAVLLRTFSDDLPPLWTGYDMWPECCGRLAWLIDLVRAVV
jgi:hypothetical protein